MDRSAAAVSAFIGEIPPKKYTINGHVVLEKQVKALEMALYHEAKPKKICDTLGLDRKDLDAWRRTSWWKEAMHEWHSSRQVDLMQRVVEQDDLLMTAYSGVMSGNPNYNRPGQAGAIMKGLELRLKMGRDPVLTNSLHVHKTEEKIIDPKELERKMIKLAESNPEALLAYAGSGNADIIDSIEMPEEDE